MSQGVILILGECRVTGRCDSLFVTLLFSSFTVFTAICVVDYKHRQQIHLSKIMVRHIFSNNVLFKINFWRTLNAIPAYKAFIFKWIFLLCQGTIRRKINIYISKVHCTFNVFIFQESNSFLIIFHVLMCWIQITRQQWRSKDLLWVVKISTEMFCIVKSDVLNLTSTVISTLFKKTELPIDTQMQAQSRYLLSHLLLL